MKIGDRIRIQGMTGRVVALISKNEFSPDYPAEHWAHLGGGTLIDTQEAGVIHYPSFDGIDVEKISN